MSLVGAVVLYALFAEERGWDLSVIAVFFLGLLAVGGFGIWWTNVSGRDAQGHKVHDEGCMSVLCLLIGVMGGLVARVALVP
jgi:hypothetical protein